MDAEQERKVSMPMFAKMDKVLLMFAKMDRVLHMVSKDIREAKIASAGDVQQKIAEDLAIIRAGGSVADPPEPNIPPLDLPQTLAVDHQQLLPSVTRTHLIEFAYTLARHMRRRIYEGQGIENPVKTRILVDLLVVDPREDQRGHERVSLTILQTKNFLRQVVMNTRLRVFREPTFKRRSLITERRKMNAECKAQMSKPDQSPVGRSAVGGNDHAS